jgi:hypothetical protein
MADKIQPVSDAPLRLGTMIAIGILLVTWVTWKIYKLETLLPYGFFSWQFMSATILGVIVLVASLRFILWAFEPKHRNR